MKKDDYRSWMPKYFRTQTLFRAYVRMKATLDELKRDGLPIKSRYTQTFLRERDPWMDLYIAKRRIRSWKAKQKRPTQYTPKKVE